MRGSPKDTNTFKKYNNRDWFVTTCISHMCILLKVLVLDKTKHLWCCCFNNQVSKVRRKTMPCLLWTLPRKLPYTDSDIFNSSVSNNLRISASYNSRWIFYRMWVFERNYIKLTAKGHYHVVFCNPKILFRNAKWRGQLFNELLTRNAH